MVCTVGLWIHCIKASASDKTKSKEIDPTPMTSDE